MNTQTRAQDINFNKGVQLNNHPEEPSLKGFFSFLVQRRSFYALILAAWGFMLGGAFLLLLTLVATALLGGSKWIAASLCCLLGGYVLYFANPALKKIYYQPRTNSRKVYARLFATATQYGMIAPFYTIYLLARVFYWKHKLIYTIKKCNDGALERREEINGMHRQVMELREKSKKKAQVMPRGHSQIVVLQSKIEGLRQSIRASGEENEAYLLDCRQQARDLGIVLREQDNMVSLPPNATVLRLLSIQVKKLAILGLNG